MKKNGSALIYVIILMIPIMLISLSLVEISNINFKISDNVICSRQALYNAESGLIFGIRKLEEKGYVTEYNYNNQRYIIFDSTASAHESQNYSETYISYFDNKFTITSRGHYRGFNKSKSITVNRNP